MIYSTAISVQNLVAQVDVGIYPHEIGTPQPVRLDVDLHIAMETPIADQISSTLDYDDVQAMIYTIAQSKHYNLLETLCHDIARASLEYKIVIKACVRAQKLALNSKAEAIVVKVELLRTT